ncbi:MAG: DUF92 domain-containing protein [Candidatus Diapherotrites archaeon]|uniref:DUF92 domain-containing protein n=1 Tax=Candidatus Iainarchaeum sp. TaxID=3101447 RepID=A0A8T3YL39_9ARCH|nr:DUF92 domain-containing protein [Candidatus Diapherotrites archaeon]
MFNGIEPIIVIATIAFFSAAALLSKSLTKDGIIASVAVGIIAYFFAGFAAFAALVIFFAIGDAATVAGRKGLGKHEPRNWANILGNTGAGAIALALGHTAGFFGAISAAFSDTISSEIGMLSASKPVLVTSLREVEKGTNGGITLLGLAAAAIGGAIIGAVYYAGVDASIRGFAAIALTGIAGSLIDSISGALLQNRGLISNNQVNFLSSMAGAAISIVLFAAL